MTLYKIVYQAMPYNYNAAHALVIEALDKEAARKAAEFELTKRGHVMGGEVNIRSVEPIEQPTDYRVIKG